MDKISRLKQEDLLSLLIFDDKSAKIIRNVVPLKLFEGFSRRCADQIYGYIDHYGEAPQENIASLLEDDREGGGSHAEKAKETLAYCYETRGKVRADFVLNSIQNFLRHLNRHILTGFQVQAKFFTRIFSKRYHFNWDLIT